MSNGDMCWGQKGKQKRGYCENEIIELTGEGSMGSWYCAWCVWEIEEAIVTRTEYVSDSWVGYETSEGKLHSSVLEKQFPSGSPFTTHTEVFTSDTKQAMWRFSAQQAILWVTSWVSYILPQFWGCLPGDMVRSHRLRAGRRRLTPTLHMPVTSPCCFLRFWPIDYKSELPMTPFLVQLIC